MAFSAYQHLSPGEILRRDSWQLQWKNFVYSTIDAHFNYLVKNVSPKQYKMGIQTYVLMFIHESIFPKHLSLSLPEYLLYLYVKNIKNDKMIPSV